MARALGLADKLLDLCRDYADALGISLSTVSNKLFNDGRTLERVATGGSLTVRNYEEAIQWLSDNWPEGLTWPDHTERPAPQPRKPKGAKIAARRLRRVAA